MINFLPLKSQTHLARIFSSGAEISQANHVAVNVSAVGVVAIILVNYGNGDSVWFVGIVG